MSPWVSVPLTIFVTYTLVGKIRGGKLQESFAIICSIRPSMVLSNIPAMIVTLATANALIHLPVLDWSWMRLLGSSKGNNITAIGFQYLWFAPIFAILLIAAIPLLAKAEENAFRDGTRDWKHGIVRSVKFGLAHVIAGVPIGAALALSIGGLWFTHQYFKGGVQRSTAHHTAWNFTLIGIIIIALIVTATP